MSEDLGSPLSVRLLAMAFLVLRITELKLPSINPWTHAESGLTYDEHRPIFAFIENGVRADAIYQNLDDQHLIRFNPLNPYYDLYLSRDKIQNFRHECRHYRSKKSTDGVIDFAKTLFAGLGMISVLTFIFKD